MREFGLANCVVLVLAMGGMIAVAGCGGSDPFGYVQVSGKVTYEDGTPIPAPNIQVTFAPQSPAIDAKTHPPHGTAEIKEDGTFDRVTSRKFGDGIVRGRHKVLVQALDAEDRLSDAVPPDYADPATTPLEVDTADAPFHLKIAKPKPR